MGRPKRTHCNRNHLLSEDNLYTNNRGSRQCKICRDERNRKKTCMTAEAYNAMLAHTREQNKQRKFKVLSHYGPNRHLGCCWDGCDVVDIDMLSLDHVNNDGAEHRKLLSGQRSAAGTETYRWVERNGFPPGFQTLCFNHQMKKQLQRNSKTNSIR